MWIFRQKMYNISHKDCNDEEGFDGSWDSFNVVDVTAVGQSYNYKLTTTIMVEMNMPNSGINLTGFLKKNVYNS